MNMLEDYPPRDGRFYDRLSTYEMFPESCPGRKELSFFIQIAELIKRVPIIGFESSSHSRELYLYPILTLQFLV